MNDNNKISKNQNPENLPTSIKFPLINSKNKLLKLFPLVCKNIGVNRAISISMLSTSVGIFVIDSNQLFATMQACKLVPIPINIIFENN